MKISQAKEIVATMNLWQMFMMGIVDRPEKELDNKLTIYDLLDANRKVKNWNLNQRNKQIENGGSCSQQVIMADRLIAAIYVAMNYSPDSDVKAIMGNVGVGCVKMKY